VLRWLAQNEPPAAIDTAGDLLSWMKPRWDPTRFVGSSVIRIDP